MKILKNIFLLSIIFSGLVACAPALQQNSMTSSQEEKPYQFSVEHIKQAAAQGDPDAEYALGYMYYYGRGVTRDSQTALTWINKAATQGQPQAVKALALLQPQKTLTSGSEQTVPTLEQGAAHAPHPKAIEAGRNLEVPKIFKLTHQSLMRAPSHNYTIQLFGTHSKVESIHFINRHKLQSKAIYYRSIRKGKSWYVVVYGLYPDHMSAERALRKLPKAVRNQHPWVISIGQIRSHKK